MSNVKTVLIGAFVIAALLGGRPAAAEKSPLTPSSCLSLGAEVPEPLFKTPDGCYESFCPNDDYCREICSTALTATCVSNVCQYTFSTPPPPPPGGCPYQGICAYDYHCAFPGGITGTCVNGSCVC